MLKLAQQLSKLKKTHILAYKEHEDYIVFVLASGPKLSMTAKELKEQIEEIEESKIEDDVEIDAAPKSKRKEK